MAPYKNFNRAMVQGVVLKYAANSQSGSSYQSYVWDIFLGLPVLLSTVMHWSLLNLLHVGANNLQPPKRDYI